MAKQLLRTSQDKLEHTGGRWAQAWRSGNIVLLQGQTGMTLDGEIVFPGDPAAQTRQALDNIRTLMELAGGTLNDVVKIVVYVTDHAHRKHVYPIIEEYFGELMPCSTGLVVSGLARSEFVMEIDAYGLIDD